MNSFDVFMIIVASIVLFIVIFSAIGSLSARNQQHEAEQRRQQELQQEQRRQNRHLRRQRQPNLPVIEVHRYPRYYDREVRLNFDIVENDEIDDGTCCICLTELREIYEEDKVLSTDCGHKYHKSCLEGWLKSKNYYSLNCPLCLQQLV